MRPKLSVLALRLRAMPLLLVALCVPTLASAAQTNPGSGAASEVSSREVDVALEAWQAARAHAAERHLRALADAGQPRDLLLAALLWPMVDGWRHVDAPALAQAKAASPAPDWFRRAMASRGDDRLVTWFEATGCSFTWAGCDRDAALAALSRWDEDFDMQLMALVAAVGRDDADAVRTHLHAAARSGRQWQPMLELGRALLETADAIPVPPLSPALAGELGRRQGLGGNVDAAELSRIGALAVWVAVALPSYTALNDACQAASHDPVAAGSLSDCLAVYAVLADGSSLIERLVASRQGVRLTARGTDQDASRAWRERLRHAAWLHQQSSQLFATGATPPGYIATLLGEGEIAALERLLAAAGLPGQAPVGWLPDDARLRMLVQEGREPEPEPAQGG